MKALLVAMVGASALLLSVSAHGQAAPIDVPPGTYALDKTHASLTWRVSHLGFSMYTARFTDFDATIELDPKQPTRSTVNVRINPMSVRTDFPAPEKIDFDRKIGEEILKGKEHPEIRFRSTGLVATGPTTGRMTGDLTFLGVTKPVTLDVRLNGAGPNPFSQAPTIGFSATGSLQRSAFGSTAYAPGIGDTVELLIEAEFQKK